jgi:hypothetical protein
MREKIPRWRAGYARLECVQLSERQPPFSVLAQRNVDGQPVATQRMASATSALRQGLPIT